MRVLSPRIDPPLRRLDGSTASTATRWPAAVRWPPSSSMNVDLPAPGVPVMPRRMAPPVRASTASRSAAACGPVVGARRLDQSDRLGERAPVALDEARCELLGVGHERGV